MAKGKGASIASVKQEDDWQVEADLRTLMECERIEKDPKRLAKAKALARKRLLELGGIAAEGAGED